MTQFSIHNVFTFPLHLIPLLLHTRPSVSYSAEEVVQEHHLLVSTQQCESEAACRVGKAIAVAVVLVSLCGRTSYAQVHDVLFVLRFTPMLR